MQTSSFSKAARYADPAVLMKIKSLDLRVKAVMEGFFNGLHRSPFHGFSVEFTEYRQYTEGDDLRYLDWKIAARSDRYYIKLYEDETNLRCNLILDNSKSMKFGSVGYTKSDYAKTLTACLAYALIQQRDAAGLVVFDEKVDQFIPARFRHGQLRQIFGAIETAEGGTATDIIKPLEEVASQVRKRGMVVLTSDLLAPLHRPAADGDSSSRRGGATEGLERNLGYLAAGGHELVVFQILDPQELNFEFDAPAMFEDLETGRRIYIDPDKAREQYQRKLHEHLDNVRRSCEKLGATYELITIDQPLEVALAEFLLKRQNHRAASARTPQRNAGRTG
jgi:uncharacterized protein (DUF58 family)